MSPPQILSLARWGLSRVRRWLRRQWQAARLARAIRRACGGGR